MSSTTLNINGYALFTVRSEMTLRLVGSSYHVRTPNKRIYSYSFALKPEEHQPSGTANMSRIDNATLIVLNRPARSTGGTPDVTGFNIDIYATNYNVLRIMSGMGGLAYSN